MTQPDEISRWVGKTRSTNQTIDPRHAGLLAVTLNAIPPEAGQNLPPCWQWAWFNDAVPSGGLGRDGHPEKGGFLPPVNLPRRMWAGGEMEFHAPLEIGRNITKRSVIEKIDEKQGKTGKLCIVTVGHDYFDGEKLCIREKQNLVYREDPDPASPAPTPPQPPMDATHSRQVEPDPVLMFRYSALTFNGHRIHYDADYARDVEGYPGLVFHAPLTATLLCTLAADLAADRTLARFRYRATSPLFSGTPFAIRARQEESGGEIALWAETPGGGMAMQASAILT